MKILNKNKIIVSALALCIGASLAGSISGTIAWYQYSTRANVAFIGKSGGFSGNLQMRFAGEDDNAWRTRITWQEMNANLATNEYATKIVPMTFGTLGKDSAISGKTAYTQPIPGIAAMTSWGVATKANFAQFTLQLRYNERDGELENNVDAKNIAEDVYLTQLLIQEDANNAHLGKADLSDAVRVHISSNNGSQVINKLYSNPGKEMATKGTLDVDGDGDPDQGYLNDEFGLDYVRDDNGDIIYDDVTGEPTRIGLTDIIYGDDDGDDSTREVQSSYKANTTEAVSGINYTQEEIDAAQPGDPAHGKTTDDWKVEPVFPGLVYSENNKLFNNTAKQSLDPSKSIGQTVASENSYLSVTITIWVEGWQPLEGDAIWHEDYIKSNFNVGIQFAVQDKVQ